MSRQTTACLLDRDPQQPEAANARFKMSRSFLVRKFDVAPDKSTWSKNALDKRFKSDSSRIDLDLQGMRERPVQLLVEDILRRAGTDDQHADVISRA